MKAQLMHEPKHNNKHITESVLKDHGQKMEIIPLYDLLLEVSAKED